MTAVSQSSSSGSQSVDREIYQASLLKKAIKAEGDSAVKLLESTEQDSDGDEGSSKVGARLNAYA